MIDEQADLFDEARATQKWWQRTEEVPRWLLFVAAAVAILPLTILVIQTLKEDSHSPPTSDIRVNDVIELRLVPLDRQVKDQNLSVVEQSILDQLWGGFSLNGWERQADGCFCVYVGRDTLNETVRIRRGTAPPRESMTTMQYANLLAAWDVWRSFYQ